MKNKQEAYSDLLQLEYIKIDHKNKIEELPEEKHYNEAGELLKRFPLMEDNIGGEINKLFQGILPESKEPDTLKLITAISVKSKTDNDRLENCLNEVMNRPENNALTLTRDLSEQLSTIIKEIFKKIKKHSKIKNYEQLIKETRAYNFNQDDILKKYIIQKNIGVFSSDKNIRNIKINNNEFYSSDSLTKIRKKQSASGMKTQERSGNDIFYKFTKNKEESKNSLPVEMLILMRKFYMIKVLRLIITNGTENNSNYEEGGENYTNNTSNASFEIDQNDLQNHIMVLLNIKWLFFSLVELEIDFSNSNLTESEINLYKYSLKKFAKLVHKEMKITTYSVNSYNKRNYESIQKSLFSQGNTHSNEDDYSSDVFSSSITSSSLNYSINFNQMNNNLNNNNSFLVNEDKGGQNLDNFIKKYKSLLEMIIVYGYFIRNMENIIKIKFILPLNLGYEILEMAKRQRIVMDNFHFLSFINKDNIIHSTIDFNSLDSQTFEKVLCFLNKNQITNVCNLSFFPPEEYFKTELLFKILQNNDDNYKLKKINNKYIFNKNIINDLRTDEDLDAYILRKLAKNFEKNLKELFYFFTMKTHFAELSLIFDLPTILVKNGHYNNVIMKFILNMFIIIDKTLNHFKTLSINAENFIFDSRKNPILNDFFDKLSIHLNRDNELTSLTFQVKLYCITKIYRLIPYNLTYLSLGSFDYDTFKGFVDYFASGEFSKSSKLNKLKITLNNSVFEIDKVYKYLVKLFTEYPKSLTEISLFSSLTISYKDLINLLMKTNYNTLSNILLQFNKKSIMIDENLKKKLEYDISNNLDTDFSLKIDNFVELFVIKRNKKLSKELINLMMHLNKNNKNFLKYNIYTNIEKYYFPRERKNAIIQFK